MSNRLAQRKDRHEPPRLVYVRAQVYRPGSGWPIQVQVHDAETHDPVMACNLATAKAWLDCWGYSWVTGSNGYYTRAAA